MARREGSDHDATYRAALAALLIPAAAAAQDAPTLPKTLAWTTHDVGTAGYSQTIAIGKALQDAYGVQLRALAMATDQSRLAPARDGRVPYALSGTDTFYAFEGRAVLRRAGLGSAEDRRVWRSSAPTSAPRSASPPIPASRR